MASDGRLPVKADVRGGLERKTSASCAAPAHRLADDEGTVIGMKASDLFQPVCECRFRCNCAFLNVWFCTTTIEGKLWFSTWNLFSHYFVAMWPVGITMFETDQVLSESAAAGSRKTGCSLTLILCLTTLLNGSRHRDLFLNQKQLLYHCPQSHQTPFTGTLILSS